MEDLETRVENLETSLRQHQHTSIDSTLPLPIQMPNVQTVVTATTVTPTVSNNCIDITAVASAFAIANPTGTPYNFQKLLIRIKDNGTPRAITWGTAYVAGGYALPSTTITSKILTLGFLYNSANALNKWMLIAGAQEA